MNVKNPLAVFNEYDSDEKAVTKKKLIIQKTKPCFSYRKGKCLKSEEECPFLHTKKKRKVEQPAQTKTTPTIFERVIYALNKLIQLMEKEVEESMDVLLESIYFLLSNRN